MVSGLWIVCSTRTRMGHFSWPRPPRATFYRLSCFVAWAKGLLVATGPVRDRTRTPLLQVYIDYKRNTVPCYRSNSISLQVMESTKQPDWKWLEGCCPILHMMLPIKVELETVDIPHPKWQHRNRWPPFGQHACRMDAFTFCLDGLGAHIQCGPSSTGRRWPTGSSWANVTGQSFCFSKSFSKQDLQEWASSDSPCILIPSHFLTDFALCPYVPLGSVGSFGNWLLVEPGPHF